MTAFWDWLLEPHALYERAGDLNLILGPIGFFLVSYQGAGAYANRTVPRQQREFVLICIGFILLVALGAYQREALNNQAGPLTVAGSVLWTALILRMIFWKTGHTPVRGDPHDD